ncbi:MAG: VWA domain-containing protein [Alphaproteobacteria bacterium]|nr:VWA domain-containing protein [Alphaproteobacteria bacterium]
MIHFAWPLIFLCLPLPLLVRGLFSAGRENTAAIKVPFFAEIKTASKKRRFMHTGEQTPLLWLLWGLLVVAAARPQISSGIQEYTVPVRDIMLTLDISRSMLHQDMNEAGKSRLEAVKEAAVAFAAMRQNDRIGIVLFSEQTSLYVPLTVDSAALYKMLSGVQAGLLGSLTAIGDAMALSLRYLESSDAKHKIIVLLTDGINNAGNVLPEEALDAAKRDGVTIYTIGVGSPDADQNIGVDVAFLRRAAEETGGLFFMAKDQDAVTDAYAKISRNEPLSKASVYLMKQKEMYFWPLLVFALIVSVIVFKRLIGRIIFARGGG